MKCEHCGSNLDLETEVCPYCGTVNRQASKHVADMKKYNRQFTSTKESVYSKARKYSDVSVRAGILAILFVILAILLIVQGNIYRIRHSMQVASNSLHSEEILKQMDQYLEEEDYLGFSQYCEEKGIRFYEDAFEGYNRTHNAASCYGYVYAQLMKICFSKETENRDITRNIAFLGDYLGDFYQCGKREKDYYMSDDDYEQFLTEYGKMKEHITAWMMAYCNMTREEAEGLENMSNARITVFLEDKLDANS